MKEGREEGKEGNKVKTVNRGGRGRKILIGKKREEEEGKTDGKGSSEGKEK